MNRKEMSLLSTALAREWLEFWMQVSTLHMEVEKLEKVKGQSMYEMLYT